MQPLIIAHRGHSHSYPENTMIAFRKAVELGADGIELDVHFSRDKKLLVHHFYALGHTDTGSGLLRDMNAKDLQSLDCGSWFSQEFKTERMPLLEQVLNTFQKQTTYEIELKDFGKEYAGSVISVIRNSDLLTKVQFTSYQYPLLSYLKKNCPQASLGLITQPIPDWMDRRTALIQMKASLMEDIIDVFHCNIDVLDESFVQDLHKMGVKIHAGICDSEVQLRKAMEIGADELTTNNLELALRILR